MALPPSNAAVKFTVNDPPPGVIELIVGADGVVNGVPVTMAD